MVNYNNKIVFNHFDFINTVFKTDKLNIVFGDGIFDSKNPPDENNCGCNYDRENDIEGNEVNLDINCKPNNNSNSSNGSNIITDKNLYIDEFGDVINIFDSRDLKENILEVNEGNIDFTFSHLFESGGESPCENPCDYTWKDVDGNEVNLDINCSGEKPKDDNLGKFDFYDGQNYIFDIVGLERFYNYSGEELEADILYVDNIKLDFNFSEGQHFKIDPINIEISLDVNSYNGESNSLDIIYSPIVDLGDIELYDGQNTSNTLTNLYNFNVDLYDGSYTELNLKTYPTILFNVDFYNGEYSNLENIKVDTIFDIGIYDSSNLEFDLTIAKSDKFDKFELYSGDILENTLSTNYVYKDIKTNIGENVKFDFKAWYGIEIDTNIGEVINFNFYESINHKIESKSYIGETNNIVINIDRQFNPNLYNGEYTDIFLHLDPYIGYPSDMYSGEEVNFELQKILELSDIDSYNGEVFDIDLIYRPHLSITLDYKIGEEVNTKPLFTVNMGQFKSYFGETLKLDNLNEANNTVLKIGEEVNFELSTEILIKDFNVYNGEEVNFELKRGAPIHLGQVSLKDGSEINTEIKISKSTFFEVKYSFGNIVRMDAWSNYPSHIDLDSRRCCSIYDNLRHIELDDAPYNHTSYDFIDTKLCERMTFDLNTRPTFKFDMSDGSYFGVNQEVNDLNIRMSVGETVYSKDIPHQMHIDLESGNLIPDGESDVVIEIDRPIIPSDIIQYHLYNGDILNINFGAAYGLKYSCWGGDSLKFELLTDEPLRPKTTIGEILSPRLQTNVVIPMRFYNGETLVPRIYEEPYRCYVGEEMSFELDAKNDYFAEFLSDGCLDNEFVDIDENGQPLPLEFKGTNVEGEKFLTYIEGRCF